MYILFFPMFMFSNFFIFISNSWMSMWMIMELSLLSLIMILLFNKMMIYELMMKYFLFQSFQSYLYLMSSVFLFLSNFKINVSMMLIFIMLMKLSIMPFHFWYIKIMMKLNWNNIYIFSVLNKIIPLYIINNIINLNINIIYYELLFIILVSSILSSIMGMNQMNLKLIMSYSSMIQMSWIILLLNFNEIMSCVYFMIYNLISLNMFMLFNMMNINNINQINMKLKNNNLFLFMMMMMMSLSGLPPFFGFLMKWLSLEILINLNYSFYYIMMFIFNSLISMFFYLRIKFLMMMNYYLINKINLKLINNNINLNYKILFINWMMFMLLLYSMM